MAESEPMTLRELRYDASMALHDAIARMKNARTATAAELDVMLAELEQADGLALDAQLYNAFEGEEPLVEATHEIVRNLFPLTENLIEMEGFVQPEGQQKEVSGLNVNWMAQHILGNAHLPIDKISRWLGFIQGVLAVRNLLSVKDERDSSRSIFHRAYKAMGILPPKTASREEVGLIDIENLISFKAQSDTPMHVVFNEKPLLRQRLFINAPDFEASEP